MFMSNFSAPAAACFVALTASDAPAVERSNWTLDPSRTRIGFSIDAVGFPRTNGQFRAFDGRLSVDFQHPERGHVAFVVKADSVDVGSPGFNGTLRGVAFFNTMRFPEIRFESTSVRKLDEQHVRVTGDLELLGVRMPLPVDVDVERAPATPGSASSRGRG